MHRRNWLAPSSPLLATTLLLLITRFVQFVDPAPSPPPSQPSAKLIYEFPNNTYLENLHVLPLSGQILFTTLSYGSLLSINPNAPSPFPRALLTKLGTADALSGIAELGAPGLGLYAVTGGTHFEFGFVRGSMSVFVVLVISLPLLPPSAVLVSSIPYPDTSMMNGLAPLTREPFTVLSADSLQGRILRINTLTRGVDVAWSDPAVLAGNNPAMPFGVNGLRIVGDYLYFTNSGQGTFGRVLMDRWGNKAGPVQILARLADPANITFAFDDFGFDGCGNAYVSQHDGGLVKITPGGELSRFAGGVAGADPPFLSPSSVATALDGKSIYVTTGGLGAAAPPGGQLLNVMLPKIC